MSTNAVEHFNQAFFEQVLNPFGLLLLEFVLALLGQVSLGPGAVLVAVGQLAVVWELHLAACGVGCDPPPRTHCAAQGVGVNQVHLDQRARTQNIGHGLVVLSLPGLGLKLGQHRVRYVHLSVVLQENRVSVLDRRALRRRRQRR